MKSDNVIVTLHNTATAEIHTVADRSVWRAMEKAFKQLPSEVLRAGVNVVRQQKKPEQWVVRYHHSTRH